MTKNVAYIVLILLALVLGSVSATWIAHKSTIVTSVQETAYARVMRTHTLRCGYALWPPLVMTKDANTGKFGGIIYDIVETAAKNLGLKVDWVEETGWGTWPAGLENNRFDMFCAGVWQNAQRGQNALFTNPLFYSPVYAYARVDDNRFDQNLSAANDPAIKIAGMDGEISEVIAHSYFAKAQYIGIPQLSEFSMNFINVAEKKADITFQEPSLLEDYMSKNPGKLRRINDKPFEVFATAFTLNIHQFELQHMMNNALIELQNNGMIDKILDDHNANPAYFLRVAKPYRLPEATP